MDSQKLQSNYPILCALITILVAISVLVGWAFDIEILKNLLPNETMMKANTAIGMIFCGLSILLLSLRAHSSLTHLTVIILNLLVIILALVTLVDYLFQVNLGFHELLFKDSTNLINPGRMSPTTAFCFLNLGIATLLLEPINQADLKKPIAAALSTTVFTLSGLIFLGYIVYIFSGIGLINYANMSIHTSILLMLLSSALLLLIHKEGNFRWVLNASITGGCIIWLMLLLFISSAYYNFIKQIKTSNEEIVHTQKVLKELNNIIIPLKNSDEKIKNAQQITEYFNRLTPIIADNSKEQELLNKLHFIIQEKKEGKILTEETRLKAQVLDVLNQLQKEEERKFSIKETKASIRSSQAMLLSPLGIFLSFTMLFIGLFILNANILERKRIKANQEQLAEIVESSGDGIIGKDLNSTITSWNEGAEKIFGYTAQEIVGQSITAIIPHDRVEEETQIINQIKAGKKIEHFETVRIRKDGKPIQISVTVSPIKNAEGEIIGASKIARDITEKKQLESQLRQSQKLSAIGELTGGVAHDFNNLLGIILGNLDLLERNLAENETDLKRVHNALKAATRGADLTKRLLAFSRMQQLAPVPTELNESVSNIVEMASRILGSNIQMQTQLDQSIPLILIDPAELESALLNLVVNSRDAMPKGGKLVIATKVLELDHHHLAVQAGEIKAGRYASLSVSDTGEGMTQEVKERVFEPFFTTKARGKGTGMGLPMVYGFVKQSGGIVRVYSEVGHGTTITLYLPFATDVSRAISNKRLPQKITTISGKALVVDDEVDLLEIATVYLKEMGFEVFSAVDAKSALDFLQKTTDIKLIVTDIIMPGEMNGFELAEEIRHRDQNIVIVYTSGFPAGTVPHQDIAKIEALLINKPYSREIFVNTIYQAFNNASSNKSENDHG